MSIECDTEKALFAVCMVGMLQSTVRRHFIHFIDSHVVADLASSTFLPLFLLGVAWCWGVLNATTAV